MHHRPAEPELVCRRVARLALLGLLAAGGCQTVESTRLVGAVEEMSAAREEAGERRAFFEVERPEPGWVQAEAKLREEWLSTDYEADRKRAFRAFELPETYTLEVDDFRGDPAQTQPTGPSLRMQLRGRQFVTVKKQHQVVTRSLLSSDSRTEQKEVPIFSHWKREPDPPTHGQEVVYVRAEDLEDEPGIWHALEGTVDEQGFITISLVPWLDAGLLRGRKAPMLLRVSCAAVTAPVFVSITPDALFYLQQLHTAPADNP